MRYTVHIIVLCCLPWGRKPPALANVPTATMIGSAGSKTRGANQTRSFRKMEFFPTLLVGRGVDFSIGKLIGSKTLSNSKLAALVCELSSTKFLEIADADPSPRSTTSVLAPCRYGLDLWRRIATAVRLQFYEKGALFRVNGSTHPIHR